MKFICLLAISTLPLLSVCPSRAATYTVNTTSDTHSLGFSSQGAPNSTAVTDSAGHISLRSALEYASTVGGSTTINLPAGTYNLSLGDLVAGTAANTTIDVQGQGAANTTIHQTQTGRLIFNVNYNVVANVVFSVENVTITGGSENENDPDGFGGNGGAILAGGSATATGNAVNLTGVVFDGNYCSPVLNAGADGGAIEMSGGGNLNVINCTFTGNNASKLRGVGYGGAINFDNGGHPGNVLISGSLFSNNTAPGAAGGALSLAGGTAGTFTITGCTFVNNTCLSGTTYGGAIYAVSGNLTGSFNRFKGNFANSGGAVYVGNNAGTMADLRNNWWGGNDGPNTPGSDTTFPATSSTPPLSQGQIAFNPWLKLNHYASPSAVFTNLPTTLTASFLVNSAGATIAPANLAALVGLPITFNNAVAGTLSGAQSAIQSSGMATATFTAGAIGGNGSAAATVDNATATASILVKQVPTITSANNTTFTTGTNGAFAVTEIGFPVPNVTVTGALPNGVGFDPVTGNLSGTPSAGTGGVYPLVFTATNIVGTNTQTFTLTVNQPPAITNINSTTFTAGALGSLHIGATGFPVPTVSESVADTLPSGVGFDAGTGTLGGTPAAGSGGTYILHFTAHNGVGADATQTFTLTVLEATPVVHNLLDSGPGSLRYVIAYATGNATVTFDPALSGQTVLLTSGQLQLANNLTIDGSGLPGGIKIDGGHSNRVFAVAGGATVTLNSLVITNGFPGAGNWGGAIANSGTIAMNNCTLAGNSVDSSSAGGAIENDGPLALTGCTFCGNSGGFAGAIDNRSACTLRNCTFYGNVATGGNGGAIDNVYSATLSTLQCTFSGNSAAGVGGAVDNYLSQVNVTNTIIAGNAGSDIYDWSGSTVSLGGSNIVLSLVNAGGTVVGANSIIAANPLLAPLGNYGGRTQTLPPQSGSPAIDAGSDAAASGITTDQRGYPRLSGLHVDIGAVEVQIASQPFTLPSPTLLGTAGNGSFQFGFTNLVGGSFTVFASTNAVLPLSTWLNLGAASETPPGSGQFQFTDPQVANNPQRFYSVRSP